MRIIIVTRLLYNNLDPIIYIINIENFTIPSWWLVSLSRRLVQLTAEASPHPTSIKIRLQIYGVCGHIASHHLNHSITSSRTFSHHPHLLISLSMLNSAVQQRQKFATLLDKHSLILENLQQPLTFNRLSRIPG